MDLKAAYDQNDRAGRLTRAGMMICFLLTGIILIATLAFAKPYNSADMHLSTSSVSH